ncbi:MAG: hypothetical protein M3317_00745, partial [Actinomycetota bacterium]|nr:hypothetical protein [Actinomycetota bacterium]
VMRWEKVTRPFLRTAEFLWQEGHTVHATAEESREEALKMHGVYRDCFYEALAIPVLGGAKSPSERFPGALETYTCEGLMGDGRALQAATSHDLGQNFSRAFDITFLDEQQNRVHAHQTSWGSPRASSEGSYSCTGTTGASSFLRSSRRPRPSSSRYGAARTRAR